MMENTRAWLPISLALGLALGSSGCGPDDNPPPDPTDVEVGVAANDPDVTSPLDAVPSPIANLVDGGDIYYIAFTEVVGEGRQPGVFRVPVGGLTGGATPDVLLLGDPLTAPVGITISLDGNTLFVADIATGDLDEDTIGAVLTLPSTGGTASVLAGTEGYMPQGLTVAQSGDDEFLYFTGRDTAVGDTGVFRVASQGGATEVVADGAPFVEPGGVAVTADGVVYVADTRASGDLGSLIRVRDGSAQAMVEHMAMGLPAGVSVTLDGGTVIVSGLDPVSRADQISFVDANTAAVTTLTDPFSSFYESAGLHRAHQSDLFSWADSEANSSGTVYTLSFTP